ncbi:EAL domain-containing protein [Novosphingobium soli]|uniref:EAL domain-containing protein n=1 Tax=Novosphingobium soli TaxID=574956 RepID=A0ABV6CZX0_9SPHN
MPTGCQGCHSPEHDFGIAMAFQPIVDAETGEVFAYEALVRSQAGEGAGAVLSRVTPDNRYAFDQQCRVAAIRGAVAAGILDTGARLSINFLPNAVYSPVACIQLTLKTAQETGFPTDRLLFEFTENERIVDTDHVRTIVETYRRMGFATALDDFGAGYSGLALLARFQPDFIKLDMELVRGIDANRPRRLIVEGVARMAEAIGITVIAEGIETLAEYETLRGLGLRYLQGYLLARPALGRLPEIALPGTRHTDAA